jgi:hypothetical protein
MAKNLTFRLYVSDEYIPVLPQQEDRSTHNVQRRPQAKDFRLNLLF